MTGPPRRGPRTDGVGEVRRGDGGRPRGGRDRDRRRRRHAGVPRHGHRDGQADGSRPGAGRRTTASTSSRPTADFTVADYREAYDAAVGGHGRPAAARRRHRAVPDRRARSPRHARSVAGRRAGSSTTSRTPGRCGERLRRARSRSRRRGSSRATAAGSCAPSR